MRDGDVNIRINAPGTEQAKALQQALKGIQADAKILDYNFRQGKISADQFQTGITELNKRIAALNATERETINATAAVYQVQQRASVGFKSLAVSLETMRGAVRGARFEHTLANRSVESLGIAFGAAAKGPIGEFAGGMLSTKYALEAATAGMRSSTIPALASFGGILGGIVLPLAAVIGGIGLFRNWNDELDKSLKENIEKLEELKVKLGEMSLQEKIAKDQEALEKAQKEEEDGRHGIWGLVFYGSTSSLSSKIASIIGMTSQLQFLAAMSGKKITEQATAKQVGTTGATLQGIEDVRKEEERRLHIAESKAALDYHNLPLVETALQDQLKTEQAQANNEERILAVQVKLRDVQKQIADQNEEERLRRLGITPSTPAAVPTTPGVANVPTTVPGVAARPMVDMTKDVTLTEKAFRELYHNIGTINQAAFDALDSSIKSFSSSIEHDGTEAFRRLFGNADNLFTQFIANVGSKFLGSLAEKGLMTLASFLPGIGPLFELMPHAAGGWITDPMVGIDTRGRIHTIAERGPEYVSNAAQGLTTSGASISASMPDRLVTEVHGNRLRFVLQRADAAYAGIAM